MSVTTYNPNRPLLDMGTEILPVRVRRVILDNLTYKEDFNRLGEWASIGVVFFDSIDKPSSNPNPSTDNFARPLFPNDKIFPIENEIVYIIALPNPDVQNNFNNKVYYYFQPINIWNSTHHNAVPNPLSSPQIQSQSTTQDYREVDEGGYVRKVEDKGTDISLGETFKENLKIKNTQPFEGDVIHEGRWGQSIRFGSTVKNSKIPNPWSRNGENGNPITIIKNKQRDDGKDPWEPQVEDINKDGSSIYLTSNQAIPVEVASRDYKSYENNTAPTSPDKFIEDQVILNSNRLLFNSKSDSILLSSSKTINLNSIESVNIDSPKTILNSNEIYLGSKDADESVILGDKFLDSLKTLLTDLVSLSIALQTPIGTGIPYTTNTFIFPKAGKVVTTAQSMIGQIESFKSKVSKTK